jgi:G-patch domain/KN17 SH3-like C-terminal domain
MGTEEEEAVQAPADNKVRLEWHKSSSSKKKRRLNNNNDDNNNNKNKDSLAELFGAEIASSHQKDHEGRETATTAADEYGSGGVGPGQEPLVIPVAANHSKFIAGNSSRRRHNNNNNNDAEEQDALAAKALTAETVVIDAGHHGGGVQPSSIPVVAAQPDNNVQNNKNTNSNTKDDDRELYQKELATLPTELTETDDAYDRVPIADFGAALLRGMGWRGEEGGRKGKGGTKNKTNDNDIMPLPRPHRLGLGAVPKAVEEITHRPLRPDEYDQRERRRDQHAELMAQHEQKQKADPQHTLQDGSLVYLVASAADDHNADHPAVTAAAVPSRHRLRARIVQLRGVPGLNKIRIKYEGRQDNDLICIVSKSQIDRLVTRPELLDRPFQCGDVEPAVPDPTQKNKKKKPMPKVPLSTDHDRDTMERPSQKKHKKSAKEEEPTTSSFKRHHTEEERSSWMIPNIRVRVITKKLGSSYYKAKGVVVDVTRRGATLQMSDGTLLDRVPDRYVETALPKEGGRCIVVGRSQKQHWQTRGRLLERHRDTAIMQERENGTALTIHLDDLAEWCGPAGEDNDEDVTNY